MREGRGRIHQDDYDEEFDAPESLRPRLACAAALFRAIDAVGTTPAPLVPPLFALLSLRSRIFSLLPANRPPRGGFDVEGKRTATPAETIRPSWTPPGLEGPTPRVRVPTWAARAVAALRSRAGFGPIPPGIVPYTSHSWVVANDTMRGLGWSAEFSNEEAWVVSHEPNPLEQLPARRRQELALVAAAILGLGALAALVVLVRRFARL